MGEIVSIGFGGGFRPSQILIGLATRSNLSHCWGSTERPGLVIDSTFKHDGVRTRYLTPSKSYRWHYDIDLRGWTTTEERQGIYQFVKDQTGKPYDIPWICGYPANRNWQDPDAWVCSELYAAAFLEVGIFRHIDQHRVTPKQLKSALEFIRKVRSKYKMFIEKDLTRSATATRLGIDNSIAPEHRANIPRMLALLARIEAILGCKITLTSVYRSPELNRQIKGSRSSAHCNLLAVDFEPSEGTILDACKKLAKEMDDFDQIIYEFGPDGWVHVGLTNGAPRKQCLTATKEAKGTVYTAGF